MEECLYASAVAHYTMGKLGEARTLLEQLLRRNPDHRYANELLGFLKEAQGEEKGGSSGL